MAVVERGTPVRADGVTVKLIEAQPRTTDGVSRGAFFAQFEVANDAIGSRTFAADAEISAGGRAVRFDAGYSSEGFGDSPPPAGKRQRITPGLPVTFEVTFDARGLGDRAPVVLTQSLPRARANEPQRVAFLLRPLIPTLARETPRRLRRAAVDAPGTPVRVASGRTVMPPGWVRADEASTARAFPGRPRGSRAAHFTAWVRADRTGDGPVILLQALRESGIGRVLDENQGSFFTEIKRSLSTLARSGGAAPEYRRGTDLGGRPAGLLVGAGQGGAKAVTVRMLATAWRNEAHTVVTLGPEAETPGLEDAVAAIRAAWSWR
ncbi:hypothetical protein [Patulibacter americanus]|uniref:hypothetical protein n=1 Tax=Patulibacter americanus TaxID=588672 RepID=UPI0003B77FC8|nr:hypothetical protein [Patulibacter americanus]